MSRDVVLFWLLLFCWFVGFGLFFSFNVAISCWPLETCKCERVMQHRVPGLVCEHVSVMFPSRLGCQDTFALVGVSCATVSGGECQVVSSFCLGYCKSEPNVYCNTL